MNNFFANKFKVDEITFPPEIAQKANIPKTSTAWLLER